jgi:hypothetical protein
VADGDFDREFLVAEGDICLMGGLIEIVDRIPGAVAGSSGLSGSSLLLCAPS